MKGNEGWVAAVVAVVIGGAVLWYFDSQKPRNLIQGTWRGTLDGAPVEMQFNGGKLTMTCDTPAGRLIVHGQYRFHTEKALAVSVSSATAIQGGATVAVGTAGLPFHAGGLGITELTGSWLGLRDASGWHVRLKRI